MTPRTMRDIDWATVESVMVMWGCQGADPAIFTSTVWDVTMKTHRHDPLVGAHVGLICAYNLAMAYYPDAVP